MPVRRRSSRLRLVALGVPRRDDIPRYQRAIPMSSTTADVKNISGNRSMSG